MLSRRNAATVLLLSLLLMPLGRAGQNPAPPATPPQDKPAGAAGEMKLPGLKHGVQVVTDAVGVAHVYAQDEHDAYFMMGYVQARDKFFQLDIYRRSGSGTLAELFGAGANDATLMSDIQNRTNGVRRAAERSQKIYSPETLAVFQAFADGVNAWLDANPLPPEYARFEITKAGVPRWEALDGIIVSKLMTHLLSFDGSDLANTQRLAAYERAGRLNGFDGAKLFFQDLYRVAPFDPSITLPGKAAAAAPHRAAAGRRAPPPEIPAHTVAAVEGYLQSAPDTPLAGKQETTLGSNFMLLGGSVTSTGMPMLASDPHLGIVSPPLFHEIHLNVKKPGEQQPSLNVTGISFSGVPAILMGFNDHIAWGATSLMIDIVDYYEESLVMDAKTGKPVATLYKGKPEPLVSVPQTYRVNQPGNGKSDDLLTLAPGARPSGVFVHDSTLLLPRRNNGPLSPKVAESASGARTAISVQSLNFSGTREVEVFHRIARARNLEEFKQAVRLYECGAQNWAYADREGNIAYFASGKAPLREDLQAGALDGSAPNFVRDGSGARRHDWVRKARVEPGSDIPFETLPFEEMPQVVNPAQGFLLNANNDPDGSTVDNDPFNQTRPGGKGIYYLTSDYNSGYRLGMMTRLVRAELDKAAGGDGTVSAADLRRIQGNVQLLDAQVLTPSILRAFEAARAPGAPAELAAFAKDPAVAEAVGRLARWDFSTPTGIVEGFDAADADGKRLPPSAEEVAHSVAATIYSVWRSWVLTNTFDTVLVRNGIRPQLLAGNQTMLGLRVLLDNFGTGAGKGVSGLRFFDVPEVNLAPEAERDIIILKSLKDGLNLLAGDSFAPVFKKSTRQDDYRWGKLHRMVIRDLSGTLSIPPAAGFENLSAELPGVAVDGGYEVVDLSHHYPKALSPEGFLFSGGPARRFLGVVGKDGINGVQVLPGGQSGNPESKFFANQLGLWLTNNYHEMYFKREDVMKHKAVVEDYAPAKQVEVSQ
jgi:penicillin amidase